MIPFWKKNKDGGKKKPPKADVPKTAQQSIPMQRMFEDGTCRVKANYYTRTIAYQDINYQLAQQEDKTAIFEEWCSFLNFFDSSIKFELSFVNMATDSTEFEKSIRIPFQRDGFDDVRAEYSQMLRQQLAKGNNGLTKSKFITFGVEGESMRQVKTRLDHIQNDLLNNFHRLGVLARPLNGAERLKLMHDMFNMDGSSKFRFDWNDLVKSGLSVKDAIAPTAFAFKNSRTFQMGGIYDEKFVKWNITDLPILPQKWQYLVSTSTKKQFGILKNLMNRPDVDSIVCATDAGREGELIFRLVYQQAGCKKSFSRLWLSSMEDSAIREGFANLKPSTEYDALYQAALCRERADWMVGINASRLFSCLYGQPLAVGRVMTPVLAMTVVREAAIATFVPQKFYTVELELTSGCTASSRRISEKDTAENLLAECRKEMISTIQKVTRKEKSENPPLLYDLTTLQRDANRLLGYSAQQTLNYVQSLYEKKLTTYPRTDSCYITDDDEEMLAGLADELEEFLGIAADTADSAVPRTRCTVNRDKVTDHHAILPTRSMLQADLDALPTGERNVLKLIIARTLMAVSKPYRYLETMLTTECAGEEFTAKGKEILDEGWKAVERKVLADILNRKQEFTTLPTMEESECAILNAEMKEGKTTPPKHFTEDTLLHSMEMASTDSMPEGVERQGIGTPATRAATIEKLVQKGFLERKGEKKTKILLPTDKGKALITVMPEEIQSLEMTADWETKLLRIERGEMEPEEFMTEIKDMISSLVNTTEAMKGANVLMKNKIVGVCPNCGANVVEREKGWFCDNKPCRFVLWKDNAFFKRLGKRLDSHVADKLLRDGRVRLKDCKSAKGKTYNATVLLSTEADGRSKFSLEFEGGR